MTGSELEPRHAALAAACVKTIMLQRAADEPEAALFSRHLRTDTRYLRVTAYRLPRSRSETEIQSWFFFSFFCSTLKMQLSYI